MSSSSADKHISFHGGVHPRDFKELSSSASVKNAPLLEKYTVILHQHIGARPELIVKKDDIVGKGQLLASPGGFVSAPLHSPTSGRVGDLCEIPGPSGVKVQALEILSDGADLPDNSLEPFSDWDKQAPEILKKRIADAGIVGMGGAAFPTYVKLSPPPDKKIDTLILNGAECEPYLSTDYRLMLERPDAVLEGGAIIGRILGVKNIFAGIEDNKPDAIAAMKEKASKYDINVIPLRVCYPQGGEKPLIYAVTGRKTPAGGLPMDVGCIVQNVATAAAVMEAVKEGKPLIERITTVTGKAVLNPGNWRFRIGTPLHKALEFAGGVKYSPGKIILGGPMMGLAQKSLDVTLMKNSSGIVLLDREDIFQFSSQACIRCGRCVEVCPMRILPGPLSVMIESENFERAEEYHVMDCMECGSCSFVCPSFRPLVQHVRRAKAEINARRRKAKS